LKINRQTSSLVPCRPVNDSSTPLLMLFYGYKDITVMNGYRREHLLYRGSSSDFNLNRLNSEQKHAC